MDTQTWTFTNTETHTDTDTHSCTSTEIHDNAGGLNPLSLPELTRENVNYCNGLGDGHLT